MKRVIAPGTITGNRYALTGAIVKVAEAAANGTFENVFVFVAVVLKICSKAVGTTFSPPPEQVVKPRKLMNAASPFVSKIT